MTKLKNSYLFLLTLTIFLVPSNLFFKFFESSAYVNGLLVDYLIPKLYLSDLPILLILSLWQIQTFEVQKFKKKVQSKLKNLSLVTSMTLITLIALLALNLFSSAKPLASLWYFFKLMEMGLFGWFLFQYRHLLTHKIILLSFLSSLVFQSLLAIYQFHTQSSFLNYLFLGEPNLSNYIGLAKGIFNGVEQILPYGTTAHPNILGGFIVFYWFISTKLTSSRLRIKDLKFKIFYLITSVFAAYTLWLTQSVSAWLALLISTIMYSFNPIIDKSRKSFRFCLPAVKAGFLVSGFLIFLISPFAINLLATKYPANKSLTRRATLNQAATAMFIANPLTGVGLNNFTARAEEYLPKKEVARFVQPVHHLGLLILSETGLLGLIIIIFILFMFIQKHQALSTKLQTKSNNQNTKIQKNHLKFVNLNFGNCLGFVPRGSLWGIWDLGFLVLLPLAALDHYLLTNQTGLLLLILFTI